MWNTQMLCTLSIIFILMIFYIIKRFLLIFWAKPNKYLLLIITWIILILTILSIVIKFNSKTLVIWWTVISRFGVFLFILLVLLAIEHVISIRYKVNPRVIIWIIICIFWLWTYFALVTKKVNLEIKSDKITQDTKILFLTDVHVDHLISSFQVKKIKKAILEEKPDFVIIAWDLLNTANTDYVKYYNILNSEEIQVPIFAVMWNHDVMWTAEAVNKLAENPKIHFLFNESIKLNNWIQLIWIIDKSVRGGEKVSKMIEETQFDEDNNLFNIFITHQPVSFEKIDNYPIDLELAWHTHNGQFYGFRELVHIVNDYGYWRYDYKWKTAYVSQWIWFWWLPFRLWTQSEIVVINLRKQ